MIVILAIYRILIMRQSCSKSLDVLSGFILISTYEKVTIGIPIL